VAAPYEVRSIGTVPLGGYSFCQSEWRENQPCEAAPKPGCFRPRKAELLPCRRAVAKQTDRPRDPHQALRAEDKSPINSVATFAHRRRSH